MSDTRHSAYLPCDIGHNLKRPELNFKWYLKILVLGRWKSENPVMIEMGFKIKPNLAINNLMTLKLKLTMMRRHDRVNCVLHILGFRSNSRLMVFWSDDEFAVPSLLLPNCCSPVIIKGVLTPKSESSQTTDGDDIFSSGFKSRWMTEVSNIERKPQKSYSSYFYSKCPNQRQLYGWPTTETPRAGWLVLGAKK